MSAYLDTRVSLYAGRLWQDGQVDGLIGAPDDTVANALAHRGLPQLAASVGGVAGQRQDPRSLEQRIVAQILDETRVLIRPLSGAARAFLAFWTARFEMSNVKTLLRSKMAGERPAAVLERLTPMGALGRLDNRDLAHAEDVGELLRRLASGPYAGIVQHARLAFEQSGDPFSLDAALDQGYYEGLTLRARPFEKSLGPAFRQLMADLVDRVNLVWLLRYRFNYGLPPAQVYYLLVGSHYSLSSARLKQLAALDGLDAVLAALPAAWRARLSGAGDISGVHARMEHVAARRALRVLHSRAPAMTRAFAYLLLRERDLRAVRSLLRGRHLGLADGAIREALWHVSAEGA